MSDTYTELFYHFVWGTKNREHYIGPEVAEELHRYINIKAREFRATIYAINSMPDHTHLACTLPTTVCIANFLRDVKGASAHFINHRATGDQLFWQPGYGALTFSKRSLPKVIGYIQNQQIHHSENSILSKMERISVPTPASVPEGVSSIVARQFTAVNPSDNPR